MPLHPALIQRHACSGQMMVRLRLSGTVLDKPADFLWPWRRNNDPSGRPTRFSPSPQFHHRLPASLNDSAKGGLMDDRKGPFVLRKRRLVDMIALALALGLVLGISVITLQSHASGEQLAKATVTRR